MLIYIIIFAPPVFAFASFIIWLIHIILIWPWSSPLQNVQGPESKGLFHSDLISIMDPEVSGEKQNELVDAYGQNIVVHGFGSFDHRLLPLDPTSMAHVLNNTDVYHKPWQSRRMVGSLLGEGISIAEGADYRRQRKIIMPAFSAQSIRALTPIFLDKAKELRDKWDGMFTGQTKEKERETVEINVLHWFERAVFDVIGLAGFNYRFDALTDETNPVYRAFRSMFKAGVDCGQSLKPLVEMHLPWVSRVFPDDRTRQIAASRAVINKFGNDLVAETKAGILAEAGAEKSHYFDENKRRDILTLLVASNMSSQPTNRLSDSEMIAQISTLLFAGSDSTSLALSWTLHLLATHPEIQTKLRNALASHDTESTGRAHSPTHVDTELDVPYLDYVVREALRMVPPIHSSIRVPTHDDVIPVSSPVRMRDGTFCNEVRVKKGTMIHVPIEGYNHSKSIWGADVSEFKPERWEHLPAAAGAQTGAVGGFMTFSHGPRICPGARFAMIEIKAFLATLVPHFEFTPTDDKISKMNVLVTRPWVSGKGVRMPIRVSRVEA